MPEFYSSEELASIAALTNRIRELNAEIARLETLRSDMMKRRRSTQKPKPRDLVVEIRPGGRIKEPHRKARRMRMPKLDTAPVSTNGHHG